MTRPSPVQTYLAWASMAVLLSGGLGAALTPPPPPHVEPIILHWRPATPQEALEHALAQAALTDQSGRKPGKAGASGEPGPAPAVDSLRGAIAQGQPLAPPP